MEHRGACLLFVLFASLLISCEPSKPAFVDARDLNPFSPDALCAYHIGDPEAGLALFNQTVLVDKGGCVTCHSMMPNTTLAGPSLHGIASTAEDRIEGVIAANYIYLSIVDPNYYVVDGFAADIMPNHYHADLSKDEITNLVSYLMTLKAE